LPSESSRFETLVLPHLDAAYNLARWLTGREADAQDAVQEACLRAMRFIGDFRGSDARPWLLKIVRNTCLTSLRKRRAHETMSLDAGAGEEGELPLAALVAVADDSLDPHMLLLREANVAAVREAIEKLPPEYREAVILREMEQMSYKQIADVTDVPIGTVMSRLARARRRLAELLSEARPAAGEEVGA
jgi:RNA polymerase sigma-70 factor (ECF subfamily)